MKLTFFSNYLSIHQLPLCLEFYSLLGEKFHFIATEAISEWRKKETKYEDLDKKYSQFVITTYDSDLNKKVAKNLALESDVVIIGSAPDDYIIQRLKENKLTFKYAERHLKQGINIKNFVRVVGSIIIRHGRFQKYPLYMLCASAYTASDLWKFGCYKNKCYRWGYFPEVKNFELQELLKKKEKGSISILWVGRLISWKHPDLVIRMAEELKKHDFNFDIKIVGNGEMKNQLQQLIENKKLSDNVHLLGALSQEKVREEMEKANIFLFTSDRQEGWGAVLNEAMSSGCAVIGNYAAGSTPFLIKDNENGYSYMEEKELQEKLLKLVQSPELIKKFGENAYRTMASKWNAEIASKRFIKLVQNIQNEIYDEYKDGPCSFIKNS